MPDSQLEHKRKEHFPRCSMKTDRFQKKYCAIQAKENHPHVTVMKQRYVPLVASDINVPESTKTLCVSPVYPSHSTTGHVRCLLKKYRRFRRKQIRRREYNRLRLMVPAIAKKSTVSKVEVIEETIKYIDELHSALIARFQTRGLPSSLQGLNIDVEHIDQSQIQELVRHFLPLPQPFCHSSTQNTSRREVSFWEKAESLCRKYN